MAGQTQLWARGCGIPGIVVLIALAFGCGDDGGTADATPDGGGADGGSSSGVAAPQLPWLGAGVPPLEMTPCPEGWREVMDDTGVSTCDPYPASGRAECAPGMAHFPGESECRPIGRACPAGDFGEVPADGPVVYVLATAAPSGDGSEAAPFRALTDVPWDTLAAGTTVALGKGEYAGSIEPAPGTRVSGACVAETALVGEVGAMVAVVSVGGAGEPVGLDNIAFRMTSRVPIFVDVNGTLELSGVLFDRSSGVALSALGAGISVTATDVVVRDTLQRGPVAGRGFDFRDGASLTMERAIFSGHFEASILADGAGTTLSLTDVVISDTSGGVDGAGFSLMVINGATVEVTEVLLEGAMRVGVLIEDVGTSARMTDTIVRGTRPAPDGAGGQGITVGLGASLEANRLVVEGNRAFGLAARSAGTRVELTDAVVRDTEPQELDGGAGTGVYVVDGAVFSADRLLVARNREAGIVGFETGSTLTLTDVVVRDTRRAETGPGGRGIGLQGGARLEAERLLLMRNEEFGFLVSGPQTGISLVDSAILDTLPVGVGATLGHAAVVGGGATMSATRVEIARAHSVGLFAHSDGTEVTLTDVAIHDIEPEVASGGYGYGLVAQEGSVTVTGERVLIRDTVGLGAAALGGGTSISLTHVDIEGVRLSPREGLPLGFGVTAMGGSLSMDQFQVSDVDTCGLMVAPAPIGPSSAALDVSFGVVKGIPIGACIQVDGYDLERVSRDVQFRDNGTNLDTTSLPVPDLVVVPE